MINFKINNCINKIIMSLCLLPSISHAVAANALQVQTTTFLGYITGNMLPISSILGLVIGVWRTYATQSLGPLLICGGAGIGSGLALNYFQATFPCVL